MAAKQPPPPDRYAEAIAWFRNRVPMTDEEFAALDVAERQKAFTVAGVTQARPIQEIFNAIDRAIADGTTLDDFKDEVGAQLEESWGGPDPSRVETVFRTNTMSAYNGARSAIFSDPVVREARPYLQFHAVEDSRTSDICEALDGKVLPADDPFWQRHTPPLHHNAVTSETPIATDAGLIPAGLVRPGMMALSHTRRWRLITAVLHKVVRRRILRLHLSSGRVLRVTNEHPILVDASSDGLLWRKAGDLKIGNHLLEHAHQMMRTEHTVIVDADHAPALIDQPAIANKVMAAASCRPVILAIDLDSDELGHEGDVDQEGSSRMLGNCPSSEESEEMLFGWGEYLAIARGPGQGGATTDLMAMDGVAQKHSVLMALDRARCGGAQPPCPVVLAASLGDDARIATHDLHLVALGAHGDRMLAAPHREGSVGEGKLSLKGAKATLSGPVLLENHGLEGALVSEVEWHATTIVSIVGEEYFGELCDLTVDEDQSYVAAGIVVHNCRSILAPLSHEEAHDEGITSGKPDTGGAAPDEGFGRPSAPGDGEPDLSGFDPDIRRALEKRLE
jgi:SPP1 gp7 family putative phage head morphogenesis protein